MDKYQGTRDIPLRDVMQTLGIGLNQFKKRPGKKEWYGPCIFHKTQKNKTSFSFDDRRFNCFSCGEHGSGAIDLTMKLKKIGFQEAVNFLGEQPQHEQSFHKQAREQESSKSDVVTQNPEFRGTYEKFYVKSEWLARRGHTEETLKLFGVGQYFNPARKSAYTNKVFFPIRRFKDGVKTGYLIRTIEENSSDPKYIFPKGFAKQLEVFGAWHLKADAQAKGLTLPLRVGFVVESPLCVMKYWQMGFCAVSPFGAYVSEEQCAILAQLFRGVVYLPDSDKRSQSLPTVAPLLAQRLWLKCPPLPEPIVDPEKLSPEQILALLKS